MSLHFPENHFVIFFQNVITHYEMRQKLLQNILGQLKKCSSLSWNAAFITKWTDKVIKFWTFITKCTVITNCSSTGLSWFYYYWHKRSIVLRRVAKNGEVVHIIPVTKSSVALLQIVHGLNWFSQSPKCPQTHFAYFYL